MHELDVKISESAVLGAGGKMGRGIALVILHFLAKAGISHHKLLLIDTHEPALKDLKDFLVKQLAKALKIGDEEALKWVAPVEFSSDLLNAASRPLIFEAIAEDLEIKAAVFQKIDAASNQKPYYFSNTSSIPIAIIAEKAHISGRLIGFHFYNPPFIQKLIELIIPLGCEKKLVALSDELILRFDKVKVVSNDIAGFIGNGHFIREASFALNKIRALNLTRTFAESVYLLDFVTKNYLIRPMGIFQLMDYVGLDIVKKIADVMRGYLSSTDDLEMPYLESFLESGLKGGISSDGQQQNGFFSYREGKIAAVYDFEKAEYVPLSSLPMLSCPFPTWKSLVKDPEAKNNLKEHLEALWRSESDEGALAKEFLLNSIKIQDKLVQDGVAICKQDVQSVLQLGFYHLY